MVRLCPSIHTLSRERIPSEHSGERAITSRPLVRASGRTCESNHYAVLPNRPARLRSPVHTCTWSAPVEEFFGIPLVTKCKKDARVAFSSSPGERGSRMICFGGSTVLFYSARDRRIRSCLAYQRKQRGIKGFRLDLPSFLSTMLRKIHIKYVQIFMGMP
jgi:hypothetical protein